MLLTAGIALLTFAPALLQDSEEGSASVRRESEFARALASDLGFGDLAEVVLADALKGAESASDRSRLLLARCEVRKLGAQRPTDPGERLDAYAAAAEAYGEFLTSAPPAALAHQARTDLAQVAYQYGETLGRVLESGTTADQRSQRVLEAESLFETALDEANELVKWFDNLDESEEKESARFRVYFPTSFFRSLIFYYWGLLYDQGTLERNENMRQAIEAIESFIFEVGQQSRAGLLGFKYIADCYAARADADEGDDESAEIYYQYVIENAAPDDATQLSPDEVDQRLGVAQRAFKGYIDFLSSRGRAADAFQIGSDFEIWLDDNNVLANDDGWRVKLALARLHSDRGDFSQALEIAAEVAEENDRSVLRLEANELQRYVLNRLPEDVEVDLGVLYQSAEGAYHQDKFSEAVAGFRRLIPRLSGSSQSGDYAAGTYYYLGLSWEKLGQTLEAAVTYQYGFENHGSDQDQEYEERLANRWYAMAERLAAKNRSDSILDQFLRDSLAAKTSVSTDGAPDSALWRQAQSSYNYAKDVAREGRRTGPGSPKANEAIEALDRAISDFQQIMRGSRYYEKAQVQSGMCVFRKIEFDASFADKAFQTFDDYLEKYVADPTNTPQDAAGRKNRTDAMAQADFYRGQVRLRQAKSGTNGGSAAFWTELLDLYTGYMERHPDQRDYGAATAYHRLEAHLALGDPSSAISEFEGLITSDAPANWRSPAAFALFQHFKARADAQTGAERLASLTEAVKYLAHSNSAASRPTWQNMTQEARIRIELQEPSTAAKILEGVMDRFGDDDKFKGNPEFFAKLDLVQAYLDQDKTGPAAGIIDELKKTRPNNLRVKVAFIRIKVGYAMLRDGAVVEVPGVDTAEAFAEAEKDVAEIVQLADIAAKDLDVNKYAYCPWWEAQFTAAYFLYKRSQIDTTYAGKHRSRIESFERLDPSLGGDADCGTTSRLMAWLKTR